MTILIIALLHLIAVFMTAVWTENRFALTVAAVLVGIIGIAMGNAAYMVADLIGVAIGFWLGISFINQQKPPVQQRIETGAPAPQLKSKNDLPLLEVIAALIFISAFIYYKYTENPSVQTPLKPSAPATHPNTQSMQPSRPQVTIAAEEPAADSNHRTNSDSSHCFSLETDAEILDCLN